MVKPGNICCTCCSRWWRVCSYSLNVSEQYKRSSSSKRVRSGCIGDVPSQTKKTQAISYRVRYATCSRMLRSRKSRSVNICRNTSTVIVCFGVVLAVAVHSLIDGAVDIGLLPAFARARWIEQILAHRRFNVGEQHEFLTSEVVASLPGNRPGRPRGSPVQYYDTIYA